MENLFFYIFITILTLIFIFAGFVPAKTIKKTGEEASEKNKESAEEISAREREGVFEAITRLTSSLTYMSRPSIINSPPMRISDVVEVIKHGGIMTDQGITWKESGIYKIPLFFSKIAVIITDAGGVMTVKINDVDFDKHEIDTKLLLMIKNSLEDKLNLLKKQKEEEENKEEMAKKAIEDKRIVETRQKEDERRKRVEEINLIIKNIK